MLNERPDGKPSGLFISVTIDMPRPYRAVSNPAESTSSP